MAQRKACPVCDGFALVAWGSGSWLCRPCNRVLRIHELVKREYVPPTRRPTRTISDAQEKMNARRVGGRRTIASGSTPVDKGDVKAADLRMECKSTEKKSYALKLSELKEIEAHCRDGEIPVFTIEYRPEDLSQRKQQYMVLSEPWFLELLNAYRSQNKE